jgi:hypothetical protein
MNGVLSSLFFEPAFFYTGAIMMTDRWLSSKFWVLALGLSLAALQGVFGQGFNAHAFGAKKGAASESLVWVFRSDGATSCGVAPGQPLEVGTQELLQNGVKVLSSRKGNDGKMHAMACGMPTGSLNEYQISREDLPKALKLGFQEDTRK